MTCAEALPLHFELEGDGRERLGAGVSARRNTKREVGVVLQGTLEGLPRARRGHWNTLKGAPQRGGKPCSAPCAESMSVHTS
jgi:hypothetical protein